MATTELSMQFFAFKVTLDGNTIRFEQTAPPVEPPPPPPPFPFPIRVEQGISMITFTLDEAAGVQFPSNPLQWFNAANLAEPVFSPPWIEFHAIDNWHFTLWDYNSTPAQATHNFRMSVVAPSGAVITSTDPMIINEPPAPVGTPGDDDGSRSRA